MSNPIEIDNAPGALYVAGEHLGSASISIRAEEPGDGVKTLSGIIHAEGWMLTRAIDARGATFCPDEIDGEIKFTVIQSIPGQDWSPIRINIYDLFGDLEDR